MASTPNSFCHSAAFRKRRTTRSASSGEPVGVVHVEDGFVLQDGVREQFDPAIPRPCPCSRCPRTRAPVDGVGVFLAVVAQVEAREREPERVDLADQRVHVGLGDHFGVVPPEVVCEDPQVLTQRLGILIPAGTDVGDDGGRTRASSA